MAKSQGWIRIYRALMDRGEYLREPFTFISAWIDLLLLAAYSDMTIYVDNRTPVKIRRGELAISVADLARRWRWSTGRVKRFIAKLQSENMIDQRKSNVINTISIINYDKYQSGRPTQKADQPIDQPNPKNVPKIDQPKTDVNNCKSDNNKEEESGDRPTHRPTQPEKLSKNRPTHPNCSYYIDKNKNKRKNEEYIEEDNAVSPDGEAESAPHKNIYPYDEIMQRWNRIGGGVKPIRMMTDKRREKIRCRLAEFGGPDTWMPTIEKLAKVIGESSFLRGVGRGGWVVTFDWLFANEENWLKVIEGNYDDLKRTTGDLFRNPESYSDRIE